MTQDNQPPQQPIKMVAFDMEFVQALANYLGTKPYGEVFQFIGRIQQTVQGATQPDLTLEPHPAEDKKE